MVYLQLPYYFYNTLIKYINRKREKQKIFVKPKFDNKETIIMPDTKKKGKKKEKSPKKKVRLPNPFPNPKPKRRPIEGEEEPEYEPKVFNYSYLM